MIQLKRVYDPPSSTDGTRFLIEPLWPRGMKKASLQFDAWLKEVGPSTKLRRWFSHDSKKRDMFCRRYFSELRQNAEVWAPILKSVRQGRVTLLFSSHDLEHNNALALKGFLDVRMRSKGAPRRGIHRAA
jgi:uncharacterized protein YeaO (DUF488 family)